jgi:phage terminase Nu1 subunit (DNA packaging protein)
LATLFGVAFTTVDLWTQQGMPYDQRPLRKGGSGWKIDVAAVLEWHRKRERENALGEIAGISESDAKRRKLAAEAAIAEHELAERQGKAVSVDDWQAATSKIIGAARAKLLAIGSAVGPDVALEIDPVQCEAIIQGAINEALQELSESDIQIESGGSGEPESVHPADSEHVGASAGPDGERVGRRRKTAEPRK